MKRIISKLFQRSISILRPPENDLVQPVFEVPDNPWNRFVRFCTDNKLTDIPSDDLPAYLVFWYMAEVENGGYLQYLLNRCDDPFDETVQALRDMGSNARAKELEAAVSIRSSDIKQMPRGNSEYVALERENPFRDLDISLNQAKPSVYEILSANIPKRFDAGEV